MIGVIGGYGFIGSHLVDELVERGEEVLVFDDLSSCWLDVEFDLEPLFANPAAGRADDLEELACCEVLVNLALPYPLDRDLEVFRKAVGGYVAGFAQFVVDATKGRILRRVVVAGALEALDQGSGSVLATVVRAGRAVLRYLHRPPNLDVEFVHLPELYGPRQLPEAGWVAALLNDATMTTQERFGNLGFVRDAARVLADRVTNRKHRASIDVSFEAPTVSKDRVLQALRTSGSVTADVLRHLEAVAERIEVSTKGWHYPGERIAPKKATSLESGLAETVRFYEEVEV